MGIPKNDGLTRWERYRLKDVEAYRKKKAAYARTPEEREKRTAYMRIWREENRKRHNELCRKSHHRNKHKHVATRREHHLKIKFNITSKDYDAMLEKQGHCCAICKKHKSKEARRFHVDHCHKTGQIRGILCGQCNSKLGWYETQLESIKKYLGVVW